jgi:ATP-dependent Zn protease
MTHQDRLGAAYHEAGHAVVATALGLTVGRIEIAINGDDAKGAADIKDAARLPLVDQLAICAAGMEAQKMFEAPTHDVAGVGDYGLMFNLLDEYDETERRMFIEAGHQRACELIRLHSSAVGRVARALLADGKIEDAAVRELLGQPS